MHSAGVDPGAGGSRVLLPSLHPASPRQGSGHMLIVQGGSMSSTSSPRAVDRFFTPPSPSMGEARSVLRPLSPHRIFRAKPVRKAEVQKMPEAARAALGAVDAMPVVPDVSDGVPAVRKVPEAVSGVQEVVPEPVATRTRQHLPSVATWVRTPMPFQAAEDEQMDSEETSVVALDVA